jgi:hypothetical protein
LRLGDIRAHVHVPVGVAAAAAGGSNVTAQIFWRRRDPSPHVKAVVVADAAGNQVRSSVVVLQPACGVVQFEPARGGGSYYVYYLPHYQSGGGPYLHFHWYGCTSQADDPSNPCILGASSDSVQGLPRMRSISDATPGISDACAAVDVMATAVVVGLAVLVVCAGQ